MRHVTPAGRMSPGAWSFRLPGMMALAWCFLSLPAQAFELLSDPFNTVSKIERFADRRFQPEGCPDLTPQEDQVVIDLTQAVAAALCYNPDTQASWAGLLAQAASYGGSQSSWLPSVSASASGSKSASFGNGFKTEGKGTSASASAGMTLFDFGRRAATSNAAERALEAAGYSYDSALQGVVAATLQAYYAVLSAQGRIEVLRESEKFSKESLDAAMLRFALGLVPKSDELQAKSSYVQSQLAVSRGENQLRISSAALGSLFGLMPDVKLLVKDVDESKLAQEDLTGKARELMDVARALRPDYAAQMARLEGARQSLKATKRGDLPSFSVSTGQSFSDVDVFNNSTTRSQSIGLSVSIPIFTGFSYTYSVRAAEENLRAQELQLQRAEINLMQDVWRALQNYQTAQETWMGTFDQVRSATELRDVSLGRYKEGVGSMLDVLNAQAQYLNALQSQIETRNNLLLGRADLVRSMGMLNLETVQPDARLSQAAE